MSRIKEERLVGEGENGNDLLVTTDTVSGEVIKSITVFPLSDEQEERKVRATRKILEVEPPLMSAEEMTQLALKVKQDTTGKQVKEIIKGMLAKAEEDVLSGSYTHLLDNKEINLTISKSIVKTLKGLGYTVSKKETSEGMAIKISWKTTSKKKEIKEGPSTKRPSRVETSEPMEMSFEFQDKKD